MGTKKIKIKLLDPCLGHNVHVGILLIVAMSLLDEVQVDVELGHVDAPEYHLGVAHDILGVRVTRHLQLQT